MIPRSIRARLTFWYAALIAISTTVLAASGVWLARQSVTNAADATLRLQIDGVRQFIESTSGRMSHDDLVDEFREYAELTLGRALLEVAEADGVALCHPSESGWDAMVATLQPTAGRERIVFESTRIGGEPYRAASAAVTAKGRVFSVVAAVPMATAQDTMRRFEWVLAGILPAIWLVAIGMGYLISRRALVPVDRLTREVQSLTPRELDRRVAVPPADDELRRLAVTFNDMLGRIEAAVAEMARLTGEASHELRTPVALIRTTAEVALSRERPAADYRQALTDVLDHAERMTTIVSDLLVLARADAGVEAPESEVADVDLTATVRAAVREMEPAADARGLTLNVEAADAALRTPGHADALRRLLVILLDNALKYTNTGGAVTVRVAAEGHHAIIDVSDTGIGIPAAERERVFDRFYRGADARARIDGSGLGLAIARGIVLRHHGAITIGPGPAGRGSTVRVELPFAAPAV